MKWRTCALQPLKLQKVNYVSHENDLWSCNKNRRNSCPEQVGFIPTRIWDFCYPYSKQGADYAHHWMHLWIKPVNSRYVTSDAGRWKTLGVPVVIGGDNLPSPVQIGLTDLPNIGRASGPLATPVPASLNHVMDFLHTFNNKGVWRRKKVIL